MCIYNIWAWIILNIVDAEKIIDGSIKTRMCEINETEFWS